VSTPPDKAALRASARGRRDALPADVRGPATVAINRGITDIIAAVRPSIVACYSAIRSEVDPSGVLDWALAEGIGVALPAVEDTETIVFRKVSAGEALVSSGFGTRAPPASALPIVPDLIVVPVVGFDRRGMRLGYGRGFYDRAITGLRQRGASPVLLGAAFAVQEVSAIPVESHDIGLDWVVTERDTLDFRPIG
jgi:5-formyltetrahydrofolate cyclo-ligase